MTCQSCIEEIPLVTEGEVDALTVDGFISTDPGPYQVKFFTSGEFSEDEQRGILQPRNVSNVRIIGDNGDISILEQQEPGLYVTVDPGFRGIAGVSYHLEFFGQNGDEYKSEPQILLPKVLINDVTYEVFTEEEQIGEFTSFERIFIQFNTNFNLPDDGYENYYKWDFDGVYEFQEVFDPNNIFDPALKCYLQDDAGINSINVADANSALTQRFQYNDIATMEVDHRFSSKYCFHLVQYRITKKTHDIWQNIESLVERTGSLFDSPPGAVIGNIKNLSNPEEQVLGIFYTASIDEYRIFITPGDTGELVITCDIDNPDPPCVDCTLLFRSTLTPPPYWE